MRIMQQKSRTSLAPRKRLGQHFLRDKNIIRKIADALEAPETAPVVEIGPGTGALTEELLRRYPSLTAIEVDDRLVALLRERFPALNVRHQDVREVDWHTLQEEAGGRLYVIGNLPYYITSPILFDLFDASDAIERAVFMMQAEVAERLVASPGGKTYGILSVITQALAEPRLLFRVSPRVFYPVPEVWSAVVRLDMHREPLDVPLTEFKRVVRTAFNQRRKTLRNSLKPLLRERGKTLPESLASQRAEALSPETYLQLTRYLFDRSEEVPC